MAVELSYPTIDQVGTKPAAGSRLLGFGAAQPDHVVDGHQLGERFGRSAEWIHTRTGINAVRRLLPSDDITDLAVAAAHSALDQAHLDSSRIDLVITASCSISADASARIARRVAPQAGALAINAACSGFCYAVSTADALIRSDSARNVLVVAAEHMSGLIDPEDLGTSIIFGDGAGAAVLAPATAESVGIGPVVWGTDGSQAELIACRPDGMLRMAGQQVFRWAVEHMPGLALAACKRAGVSIDDIEVFVPHQANLRIIEAVVRKLGLHRAVIAADVSGSGNTSAASIPIALTRLIERREARTGQLALLLGFGAGLAYAGQVVTIP
jgi:3-oxoacyl-[acyl-carrier-protein] synthase-3